MLINSVRFFPFVQWFVLCLTAMCIYNVCSGQRYPSSLDHLPAGLPLDDIEYLGDNQFASKTFGEFELDTSIKNRIIHNTLGPLIWEWNEAGAFVELHTEWWGQLRSAMPGQSSPLGVNWPYVYSVNQDITYLVNVSGNGIPFYDHFRNQWVDAIGIPPWDTQSYFNFAAAYVSLM